MRGVLPVLASAVTCAALICAAVLVPAPPELLPLIVLVCVLCPLAAAAELPRAFVALRSVGRRRLSSRHLRHLLSELERLPEVEHPRGF